MLFDFHMHSTYSDGSRTVYEIFKEAKEIGMDAIAVTDHDTILGLKEVDKLSKKYKIPFIPAAEFTGLIHNKRVHILGFGINFNSRELLMYSRNLLEQLNIKSKKQIMKIRASGINITEEEFFKEGQGGPLYRAKILRVMSRYGYLEEDKIMESLKYYFGKNGPFYIKDQVEYFSVENIVDMIRRNSGVALLAHPGKIKMKDVKIYHNLINGDYFDGFEVYHPDNNEEVRNELLTIIKDKNLYVSGGSDHHGMYNKRNTRICGINIPDKVYYNLENFMVNKE